MATYRSQQHNAITWLGQTPRSASLLATAHQLIRIQAELHRALPTNLAEQCVALRFEDQRLILGVPSAGLAAKLRQLAPSLAKHFEQAGWQINAIDLRTKGNLGNKSIRTNHDKPNELGEKGLQAFEELQQQLSAGPLSDAIAHLIARRAKKT